MSQEKASLVQNESKKATVDNSYCISLDLDSIVSKETTPSELRKEEHSKRLLDARLSGHLSPKEWIDQLDQCAINYVTSDGHSLLHTSCDRGFDAVKRCVELGADVNLQSKTNETPLSWAVVNGDIRMARCLIDHDAQTDVKIRGINFCHVAARSENPAMLYFLLRYKPEMTQLLLEKSESGFTPLHYAAQHDKFITVQYLLLQFGLDPLIKDTLGNTPLHIAISTNSRKAMATLLRFGCSEQIYAKNEKGELPVDMTHNQYLKRALKIYTARSEFPMSSWFDRLTNNRYRFGLTQHFPTILMVYVLCQILANIHLWVYLSPHNSPLHVYSLSLASVCIFLMWFSTTQANPGIIPRRKFNEISEEFDRLLFRGETKKICVTCGVVRPWRSKHCAEIDACVMRFDHYCPWIGNAVGSYTQLRFLAFCTMQPFIQACYLYLDWYWLRDSSIEKSWVGYLLGLGMGLTALVLVCYGMFMTANVCYLISRNITTNEAMNHFQYDWYEIKGQIHTNLYDMGILTNWFNVIMGFHDAHRPKTGWSQL